MPRLCYNGVALSEKVGLSPLVATVTPEETAITAKPTTQIHRLAWIIVLVSFALFCSTSIALSGGVYFFLFRSTLQMDVTAEVSRGSAGFAAVDYEQNVTTNDVPLLMNDRPSSLSTDNLSQALLSFSIPDNTSEVASRTILGTITLENNSSITLQTARRPRFTWSDSAYFLEFANFKGEADIYLTSPRTIPVQLTVRTDKGNATFSFLTNGRYSILANDDVIQLVTAEGRALLISPQANNNRLAVTGEQATLTTGANLPIVSSAPTDLLENGLFSFDFTRTEAGDILLPQRWACSSQSDGPPSGSWFMDTWNGRQAIRLIREVGNTTSQTGCIQPLDISVTQYSYLELRATIALNFQSLVNCGDVGSECPMMIFIDYEDVNGDQRTWYQGLFYNFDPQSPAPIVCPPCGQVYEHRPVSDQIWYTFESGNLFNRLPEESRPARILNVEFYASGHRYDVFVSEVALFAGTQQVIPPDVPESQN